MPKITITFQVLTPESAEHGDYEETGWIDDEGVDMTPDEYDTEEGLTAVDKAVEFLKDKGAWEASSYPFHPGTWYTQTEPAHDRAYFEQGREETHSFHLEGFSEAEQKAIYDKVTAR